MHSAPLGRRVLALVIDWIIAALSATALTGVSYPPDDPTQNLVITGFFVAEVGLLVGLLGFSIGKRVVGLRIENPDGRPIGIGQGLLRTALVCLVIPPLVQNKEGRGLHDVVSGSRETRT
jgi:uncharacterized RDD family membrane protein YckC